VAVDGGVCCLVEFPSLDGIILLLMVMVFLERL